MTPIRGVAAIRPKSRPRRVSSQELLQHAIDDRNASALRTQERASTPEQARILDVEPIFIVVVTFPVSPPRPCGLPGFLVTRPRSWTACYLSDDVVGHEVEDVVDLDGQEGGSGNTTLVGTIQRPCQPADLVRMFPLGGEP